MNRFYLDRVIAGSHASRATHWPLTKHRINDPRIATVRSLPTKLPGCLRCLPRSSARQHASMTLNLSAVAKKRRAGKLASGKEKSAHKRSHCVNRRGVIDEDIIVPAGPKRVGSVTMGSNAGRASHDLWEGTGFMPLTRGEAVGYDADLMAFRFTMRNGQQIVQCQISRAALVDLAGRSTGGAARDLPAQFEAHRELIEAIASAQFDQTSQ